MGLSSERNMGVPQLISLEGWFLENGTYPNLKYSKMDDDDQGYPVMTKRKPMDDYGYQYKMGPPQIAKLPYKWLCGRYNYS